MLEPAVAASPARGLPLGPAGVSALDGLAAFEQVCDAYDDAVAADPGVDAFCTRSDWIVPHHLAFAPERAVIAAREGESFAVFALAHHETLGAYLEPLECMWGFASPLVGARSVELLAECLRSRPAVLLGLPRTRELAERLVSEFSPDYTLRHLGQVVRWVASLEGGLDGFLSRRSRRFRAGLRSAERRVALAGIHIERTTPTTRDVEAVYSRALAIEAATWKSATGFGADSPGMREFYVHMLPRLAARGALRVLFARDDSGDLGYLYGGLVGRHFRGLQFSFAESARALSLGNVLQLEMIRWLAESGGRSYDLGTGSAYKQRWAEPGLTTFGVALLPRRA